MEEFRRYVDFSGRATRLEYWRFQLLMLVVSGVSVLLALFAIKAVGRLGGIFIAPVLLALAPAFAVVVRRLHDRGRSGWWLPVFTLLPGAMWEFGDHLPHPAAGGVTLAMAVVYLASLGLSVWGWLEIAFLRGTRGANRYGEKAWPPTKRIWARAPASIG